MTKLEKARALKCFGEMAETVELDPDPKTQDKLQVEYNCKNCDNYKYCCELADTLKGSQYPYIPSRKAESTISGLRLDVSTLARDKNGYTLIRPELNNKTG